MEKLEELLDQMGDCIGLIRLYMDNHLRGLITITEMTDGAKVQLDKLHDLQKEFAKR